MSSYEFVNIETRNQMVAVSTAQLSISRLRS
jgi:hypothetical protein